MTTVEIVMAVVMFAIAGLWLFLGIRSFMERGFLLNNAYIYATKEERKTMITPISTQQRKNGKQWIKSRITGNRRLRFAF